MALVDRFGEGELRSGLVVPEGEADGWGRAGGSSRLVVYQRGQRGRSQVSVDTHLFTGDSEHLRPCCNLLLKTLT